MSLLAPDPVARRRRTVVVAVANSQLRSALTALLAGSPGLSVLDSCADELELLRSIRGHRPDVVVLGKGFASGALLARLTHAPAGDPPIEVLVVGLEDAPAYDEAFRDAGAAGYLVLDTPVDELVAAVAGSASGVA